MSGGLRGRSFAPTLVTIMRNVLALMIVTFLGCSGSSAQPDGATSGDGGAGCGTMTCVASQVCVRTIAQGGACVFPEDGGACPAGYSADSGPCCVRDPSFACASRPDACASSLTCACAASVLCAANQTCSMSSASEIVCTSPPVPAGNP